MIRARGLGKRFGAVPIFSDISFHVPKGGALAIVGRSGCGKSTLLHILAGLLREHDGELSLGEAARRSFVPQNYGLFPWKNVRENLELPLRLHKGAPKEYSEAVAAMLAELGLTGLEEHYPAQLSGGQRQRVALGRALITRPDILLLDEPFSSLDAITREALQNLLAALWRQHGCTTVLVTHSIEEAVFLGRQILVLGGSPTRVAASLDNPGCGLPASRFTERYFSLVKAVRENLGNRSDSGLDVGPDVAPSPAVPGRGGTAE